MIEETLVLIKPDGLAKSLTGNILTRLSETKLEIAAAKCVHVGRALAEEHYKALRDKPFFEDLIKLQRNASEYVDSVIIGRALYENKFPCQRIWRVAEAGIFN